MIEDPVLSIRYQRDRYGLMIVTTSLRHADGSTEVIGTARKVNVKAIGPEFVVPTVFAAIGPVCYGHLPGHRGTPTGVFMRPAGPWTGSG